MAEFFNTWKNCRNLMIDDSSFFEGFFEKNIFSENFFECASEKEIFEAINFLLEIPIEEFIERISFKRNEVYDSSNIVQFSNLLDCVKDVPSILYLQNKDLSFDSLGSLLNHSLKKGAQTKYGENHAKTAQEFGFVKIYKNPTRVRLTSLGKCSLSLDDVKLYKIISIMLLRNPFHRKIIYEAINGGTSYFQLVNPVLSLTTAKRRLSNVKQIIEIIFHNSKYIKSFNNIEW